jgi:hypothetical protein
VTPRGQLMWLPIPLNALPPSSTLSELSGLL